MHVEMVNPEAHLLAEIANPAMKRKDVALTYAFGLRGSDPVDWRKVNEAILERWSMAGLKYIKERAWKLYEGKIEP